ncbi:MAG: OmpH family outer membrane protein [Bdellovibrionales bacterium]|nr:OmpH family outer membrane protein [Bdellovibrionales bacterium]
MPALQYSTPRTSSSLSSTPKLSIGGTLLAGLLTASLGLMPTSAAAEYRIATVDINKVLNETSESKDAREELNKESNKAKALVEQKRKQLQDMEKELKDDNVSVDSKEAEDFRQKAKDFRRFVKDTEDDLKRKFLRSNSTVTQKALKAITSYASSKGIDLVLEKGNAGKSAVLFGNPSVDITEEVIREMKG